MKVNEIFGNIKGGQVVQGEGIFAGVPATFIRFFGCVPPYCSFCDSRYSWTNEKEECKEMSINKIVKEVDKFDANLVVITGGEPAAQNQNALRFLVEKLQAKNYTIQIETSGKKSLAEMSAAVHVIMSPKQYNGEFVIDPKSICHADYFKFVVENEVEVMKVNEFVKKYNICNSDVYLMAKGETREKQLKLMPKVFEWCCKYNYTYSPRLHVLAFNKKRGV